MFLRITTLFAACLMWTATAAQQTAPADYALDRTTFELGEMSLGKSYKALFTVTSTGDKPLVLLDAQTNCSCTKAEFAKKPLRKGDKTTITVVFEAREAGVVRKKVRVRTNAPGKRAAFELTISGSVKK